MMSAASAQMIEAMSKPYRFNIEKLASYEGFSEKGNYMIQAYRIQIRNKLEFEIAQWHKTEGYKHKDSPEFDHLMISELERVQPKVINEVGAEAIQRIKPEAFLVAHELKMEILLEGFGPVNLEVPIKEIERFQLHLPNLIFKDVEISFDQMDQFVITSATIVDPISNMNYSYNSDKIVPPPSFTVSLPEEEL